MEESPGTSPAVATKSYTQIIFGRAIAAPIIGVCWVTVVEAHAASTAKARRSAARKQ